MATADTPDEDSGPQSAREFVQERLRGADSPTTPAEMAEEYGCTNGHVRNLLSDLRDEGAVERVAHGQYVAVPDEDQSEDSEVLAELPADSGGNAEQETDGSEPDGTAMETPKPTDGQAPSADRDTEDSAPPETTESMGVPLPVSANTALVAAALFLVLALWWRSRSSSSSSSSASTETFAGEEDDGAGGEEVPLLG